MADNQYFYVQPADVDTAGRFLFLRDEEAHHCANVLRKGPGDECYAVDGEGHEYVFRIQSVRPKEVTGMFLESSFRSRELPFDLTVAAALFRPDPYEWMLEKCTELGVSRFIPLRTARSLAEPGSGRLERWRKILLSAMKQSRRSVLPVLEPCQVYSSMVRSATAFDHTVLFHESARLSLTGHLHQHPVVPGSGILAVFGPEGGFTRNETELAREAGWPVLSLGSRRLRSETATVAACSVFSIHGSA